MIRKSKFNHHLLLFQIDCVAENELTARINMADAKFSFQEKGIIFRIRTLILISSINRLDKYDIYCAVPYLQFLQEVV